MHILCVKLNFGGVDTEKNKQPSRKKNLPRRGLNPEWRTPEWVLVLVWVVLVVVLVVLAVVS